MSRGSYSTRRLIVYDAMTIAEEEKLRSIEKEVVECFEAAGLPDRHCWSVRVREGVRYLRLGRENDLLIISAKQVIEMPPNELLALVRKAF